jgi:hypothetical protein
MTRIETIWSEILKGTRVRPLAEGNYKLLRIDPAFRFNVFAGLDSAGCVMLAIGVASPPPALKLESNSLDYFRQQRNDGSWLMALRLRQAGLSGVFGRLCQDLVDAMDVVLDEGALVELFRSRLALWKRLFDHGLGGLLEPYQVKGLIAELLVLEAILLDGRRSPLEAATAWVGPSGADQDFLFWDEAIEVKAVSPEADSISISSLQQLDSLVPIRITVYTMRPASPDEPDCIGLNTLVPRVEGCLASSPEALCVFRGRLLEVGYVENPDYDLFQFQPLSNEDFQVTEAFPRLTMATVPCGVAAASYSLALNCLRNRS